jgi:hypothetical protein
LQNAKAAPEIDLKKIKETEEHFLGIKLILDDFSANKIDPIVASERLRTYKRFFALTMCLLLPASLALADGDGPTRKMTGPEASAFNVLKSTFQRVLPKPPANYALAIRFGNDAGEIMLPEAIKPDQMARMSFTATYTLSREFQDGQQRASLMDRAKGTPEQQARLAALDAKDAELTRARNKTRERGEKERIRAEGKTAERARLPEADRPGENESLAALAGGGCLAAGLRKC